MCNFKNVPMTLAEAHKSHAGSELLRGGVFAHDQSVTRPSLVNRDDPHAAVLPGAGIIRCESVTLDGITYKKLQAVVVQRYRFAITDDVFLGDQILTLVVQPLKTSAYSEHYISWIVDRCDEPYLCVTVDDLYLPHPVGLHRSFDRSSQLQYVKRYTCPFGDGFEAS